MITNTVIATIAIPADPTTLAHHKLLVGRGGRRLKGGNRNATHAATQATQSSTNIRLVNSTSSATNIKNLTADAACNKMNATPIPRAGRSSIIAVCAIIANDIPTRLLRPAAITLTMLCLLPLKDRAFGSTSLCMIRINLAVPWLVKRHAGRFVFLRNHRVALMRLVFLWHPGDTRLAAESETHLVLGSTAQVTVPPHLSCGYLIIFSISKSSSPRI